MNWDMEVEEETHLMVTREIPPRTTLENHRQKELIDNTAATGNQDNKASKRLSISKASKEVLHLRLRQYVLNSIWRKKKKSTVSNSISNVHLAETSVVFDTTKYQNQKTQTLRGVQSRH